MDKGEGHKEKPQRLPSLTEKRQSYENTLFSSCNFKVRQDSLHTSNVKTYLRVRSLASNAVHCRWTISSRTHHSIKMNRKSQLCDICI